MSKKTGDAVSFEKNWKLRKEANYLHWTRGKPLNQIQLAFKRHWISFNKIIESGPKLSKKKCLEVGCGRGSLSAYFSDAGWECSLVDISPSVIKLAKDAFAANELKADFKIGDCLHLPYADNEFNLVFSIGLLEHFENIEDVLSEQLRILSPGGLFIGYVVPDSHSSIQAEYKWINDILKEFSKEIENDSQNSKKIEIYRSTFGLKFYLDVLNNLGFKNCHGSGIYSLPMISSSIEFPFTLMPADAEKVLVQKFEEMLANKTVNGDDPWFCKEDEGQAFVVWGWKDKN